MYDYRYCMNRDILCVDLKSFYASVSCILNGLDPLTTKLAVVGDTKRQGSVVLASTPKLKEVGIRTGSRLYEIPNRSDIYITNPKMQTYMNVSSKISSIALQYVPHEDFHQYSIDEFFMDITDSYHLFAPSPSTFAELLQKNIYDETGILSTIGIGSNMLLAKAGMDIEAKHTKQGIATWRYEDVPTKLWSIDNLTDMWGINKKTAKKLHRKGIFTVKDLALYPYEYLKRDFGIIGVDLHLHANGIDERLIRKPHKTKNKGLGKSQILMRDYKLYEVKAVLIEQVEDVYFRVRQKRAYPMTISVFVGYSDTGGIRKQFTHRDGFKSTNEIINVLWQYISYHIEDNALLRTIGINFTNFKSNCIHQLELFKSETALKSEAVDHALDQVKSKYGKDIVMRASSLTSGGTLKERKGLLSGHKA
ncbi:Y-family DNA polymerase [Staphylococcus agnetis]|uniref:Y-family DNA polymerase n=1 Tax=Staphylococcus agnetis TaxID=985762 RepID=UPI00208DEF86|nr:Y-family DNA polymerase [Staphylococcus agnetis]MCO4327846.1 Y-family DNA polymerase [Staphylococcus agnetis]MCO4353687.1 Y-family DNA polymerase [Staphylococcus agnetis]MCO4370243.1 Y-family DNA polymerase [Staphylococcus agnetis]